MFNLHSERWRSHRSGEILAACYTVQHDTDHHYRGSNLEAALADAEREIAELRAECDDLRAQIAAQRRTTITDPLQAAAARIRTELPTWMELARFKERLPKGLVAESTLNAWCNNFLVWDGNDDTRPLDMIECRQPGGPNTPITLRTESALAQLRQWTWRKGKRFDGLL